MGKEYTATNDQSLLGKQAIAERQENEAVEDGPFHGQQGALSGGYVDQPEYRQGVLSFIGLGSKVDRMETPITESEMVNPVIVQAVQTEAYQNLQTSDERQEFLANAVQEQNLAIQESVGEPLFGMGRRPNIDAVYDDAGIENNPNAPTMDAGIRIQKGTEPVTSSFREEAGDGQQPVTYLVPDPLDSSLKRTLKGGLLQGVRAVASAPEYITDRLGITDPATNTTYANIPVMPASTEMEKLGMDITEVIAGAATGGALVKGILAIPGLAKVPAALADEMGKVYSKMKKSGGIDYKIVFEKYLTSVLVGSGVIAGESLVLEGQNAEPLVGDWALDQLGMEDGDVKDFLGHAIDSTGINAGLVLLGKTVGGVKNLLGGFIIPKGTPKGEQLHRSVALMFLQKIDPIATTADEPIETLVLKARAMADVLADNATFKSALVDGAEINLDSAGAIMMGAEEYFRKAYPWKIAELGAEGFEEFVTSSANDLISNINQLKKVVGTAADPEGVVTSATANINRQIGDVLEDASEQAIEGGSDAAEDLLAGMVDEGVDSLNTSRAAINQTEEILSGAESGLTQAQQNTVKTILTRNADALGSTADEIGALNEAAGEQLLISFIRSKEGYEAAFAEITNDLPVDYETFIPELQKIFAKEGSLDFITSTATKEDPIAMFLGRFRPRMLEEATDDADAVFETFEQVVERIQDTNPNLDLKELYTTLRPQMSNRINALEGTDGSAAIPYLTQVKNLIDKLVSETGDESFDAAKSAYAQHEGVYGAIPELAQWEATAGRARSTVDESGNLVPQSDSVAEFGMDSMGRPIGQGTAIRDAVNLLDNAIGDQTGMTAEYLSKAWAQAGNGITPQIADALLAKTLRSIDTSNPSAINSATLIETLKPTRTLLESMGEAGQATLRRFDEVVTNLRNAEEGVRGAKEALDNNIASYKALEDRIKEDVASKFIFNLTGNVQGGAGASEAVVNIGGAIETLFKNKDAPNLIRNLMQESEDPLLVQGLQSLFLRHIRDKMYTASELGPNAKVASIAQLGNALEGTGDTTLDVLREIFKDTPEMAEATIDLLNLQRIVASGRSYKSALTVGSETVENASNIKKIDRLVMFTLGILNPMATKARAIGRSISSAQEEALTEAYKKTQAALMSSPQFFEYALRNSEKLTQSSFVQAANRFLGRQAVRELFGEQTSLSEEAQMYEALGATPEQ